MKGKPRRKRALTEEKRDERIRKVTILVLYSLIS